MWKGERKKITKCIYLVDLQSLSCLEEIEHDTLKREGENLHLDILQYFNGEETDKNFDGFTQKIGLEFQEEGKIEQLKNNQSGEEQNLSKENELQNEKNLHQEEMKNKYDFSKGEPYIEAIKKEGIYIGHEIHEGYMGGSDSETKKGVLEIYTTRNSHINQWNIDNFSGERGSGYLIPLELKKDKEIEENQSEKKESHQEKTTSEETVDKSNFFAHEEFEKSMNLMSKKVDKNSASALDSLFDMQKSGKQLSPEQKQKILSSEMKDEKKIAMLTFLNDKDPKSTINNHYKKERERILAEQEAKKEALKGKGQKAANFIEKVTRLNVD